MASPTPTKLTITEWLILVWSFGTIALRTMFVACRHALLPPSDSPGIARATYAYGIRHVLLMPKKYQGIPPPTYVIIEKYCLKRKIPHEVDELPNSGKLHWVGPRPAQNGNILLYLHGGGYHNPMASEHVSFSLKCAANAGASLALLQYTLAPVEHYPTQLQQGIDGLRRLLNITSPSKITIAGDSAGGHLALGILSHLLHPSQSLESLQIAEKLGGICLICPFLGLDLNKPSYSKNREKDFITIEEIKSCLDDFIPLGLSCEDGLKDPQLSPIDAPPGWWENCPVERILLTAGSGEIFLDDCVSFGKRLKEEAAKGTQIDVVIGAREIHAAPMLDEAFGLKEGEMATAILTWMKEPNSRS